MNAEETAQVTRLLAKLEPGFLPFEIFHQITRLVVTPIIEIVPLRRTTNGDVEILLVRRAADDPVWPGQLHVPGTTVRTTDKTGSFADALDRILSKELAGAKTSKPTFVANIFHHSGRGMEASQIFWVEVQDMPAVGEFHSADSLPDTVVQSQLDFIPEAIAHFKNSQR